MKRWFWCWVILPAFLAAGAMAPAQDYVGDAVCGICHQQKYDDYMQSGHPWKLHLTGGQEPGPDEWPHTPPPPVSPGLGDWSDVEYVIGNFYWKARFIKRDGYIYTGDDAQWNLATEEFVGYHSGEVKPYNCGRCHTTGYDPEGHQGDLEGIVGTWSQPGVRCEACHGPGSDHVDNFGQIPPPGGKDCSECHYRDAQLRMPWKSGFMRHHQQGEDFAHSPHAGILTCESCHDPHKSVVYDLGGTIAHCTDCHPGNEDNNHYVVEGMESLECIDCHMPKMGKSAVAVNPYKADVRGHLFRIMTEPAAAADNVHDEDGTTFWNQDQDGQAAITLDYACLGCHTQFDPDFTIEDAAAYAEGIHTYQPPPPPPPAGDTWEVVLPFLFTQFTVTLDQFGPILVVQTTYTDGSTSVGIGMEYDGVIFWMDISGAIFFGNIDRDAGTMSGIVFGGSGGSSIWFGQRL